jgi:hypothetical protein
MASTRLWTIVACLSGLAPAGCARPIVARYIYQDSEFGVVGIPVNTYQKRVDYRDQASALMDRHFPQGYEIVRAEEVVEGERIRDTGKRTEVEAEPGFAALAQVVKLVKLDRVKSYEERDKVQVRECRIIYKRKLPGTHGVTGQFAAATTLAPPLYVDPNQVARQQLKTSAALLAKADCAPKRSGDDSAKTDNKLEPTSRTLTPVSAVQPIPTQWNWSCDPSSFAK